MQTLLIANLIFSGLLIVGGIAAAIYFYQRHLRRNRKPKNPGDPSKDYPARREWNRSVGKLNYSSFIYFDVDRDGRYGLGDRPMAGINVRVSGAKGYLGSERSNGNGFTNFGTSTRNRKAPIREPGTYEFSVSVPPGWRLTSGNGVQSAKFRLLPGSPSGIVADEMPRPVGLAPIRYISGQTVAGLSPTISAMKGGQTIAEETLGPDAPFRFEAPEDAEAIVVNGQGFKRHLKLSPYPANLGVLSPKRIALDPDTPLETIGFNDVTPRSLRKVPSGYAGLNWFNLNAMSRDFLGKNEGYVNGNTSGDHICYTSSGHPAELWSDQPFGFHSVMLTNAWMYSDGELATIESWFGDTLVATDTFPVFGLGPVQYAPMLKQVTRIRISTKYHWQLVVDDLVLAR